MRDIENAIEAIEEAYHQRDDYPPFAIFSFDDRARYHAYIIKILEELKNKL